MVRTNRGMVVRRKPRRRAERTPGQLAQEARVRQVGALWRTVDVAGARAWRRYAEGLEADLPAAERRPMTAYNAFLSLAARRLQVAPGEAVPILPPSVPFGGDAARIVVLGEAGVARFVSDRANAEGVVTELASQPLRSATRLPEAGKYAARGFVAFGNEGLEAAIPLRKGAHALAVRFVERATGRATATFPLGIVVVG